MAIELTDLLGTDNIAVSRIAINENFQIVEEAINQLTGYLDTDKKTLSNIESLIVKKGDVNITDTLIETNGSISVGGNISVVGKINGNSLNITSGMVMDGGTFKLSAPDALLQNNGDFWLDGELVYTDLATTDFDAANELTYTSASGTNLIYDGAVAIAGKISLAGRNTMILSWTNFVSTGDAQFYLHRNTLKKDSSNAKIGQKITIISRINEDVTLPSYGTEDAGYWILKDCLEYTTGNPITTGIKFTKSNQAVDLIFNGTNWVILNIYGATVV